MINLKACARCGGDLIPEELLGDVDLVCLQCGHRTSAPVAPKTTYRIRPTRPVAATRPSQRRAA
jgi:DNA-directed RNA polymerase subunit RPC12/RpoP